VSNTVPVIGIQVDELPWLRLLLSLLRHPDPGIPELARQALLYLDEAAGKASDETAASSVPR
jgi:hypothetical protein